MTDGRPAFFILAAILISATSAGAHGAKPLTKCAPDAVVSGTVCVDTYEASVWRVPDATDANKGLVKRIRQGKVTADELTAAGATPLGIGFDDYAPCADSGQNCGDDIFAVSLPGVVPSAYITWFQAQAACQNSAKRLPSNAEWQAAVLGTPDPGADDGTTDCNSTSQPGQEPTLTGSRSACKSESGAYDMVGNEYEWVAEWVQRSTGCSAWNSTGDTQCFLGAATTGEPGALIRGGSFFSGTQAGPLAVDSSLSPSGSTNRNGFRCVR